jgi:hypothetical protein
VWSILTDNHWRPFEYNEILSDSTHGLLTSGIIKFLIPRSATDSNTFLPRGYYWIRAAVEVSKDFRCNCVGIHPNAALASFSDQDNDPNHLLEPLESGRISELVEQIAPIKTVRQPYASFDGKARENNRAFYARVSERLRHKDRAVSAWDFERIILQNFPSIYKVRCLSHTNGHCSNSPGHVTVIVIPDLYRHTSANQLQPQANKNTLVSIETLLNQCTEGLISIHAENPVFETITVSFKVSFHEAYEFKMYEEILNRDIVSFLTPWAADKTKDVAFGGQFHRSTILNFVEQRPYVDYVTDFRMYTVASQDKYNEATDLEVITTSDPRAVLVSNGKHYIRKVEK